ncbi:MFS transporter [Malaciobacter molluscorum]|uniref:MFS transporter n=1 Tax=Malaciobacter molluscorum TaxID=1032072 RepID=UPI00100B8DE1|nr:MFS transporter [Malaciobacter molluscorum]RXJ94840.1 MFS transporter [Malaciobacter molluscorum]
MKKKLTFKGYILLINLYITQYMGIGFFAEAFIGILRKNGMSLENLGIVYMLGLFWVLRFLWAPFIDKIQFRNIGHYKGWIIIFQFLMGLIFLIISNFTVSNDLQIIILVSILFAFFSSSQTVALDGLVYKNIFKKEHSKAMSIKVASGLIGMIFGGGVGLIFYTHFGWAKTMIIFASYIALTLIQVIFYKETKTKKNENIQTINFKQFITFWKGKNKKQWLFILLLYPASVSTAYGLITPMLVDFGWTLDKIGFFIHIVGYCIGVSASFCTSLLIKRYGKKRVLIFTCLGQVLGLLMLLILFKNHSVIITILIIGFIFSFYTPGTVIMSTLMMDKSTEHAPAAQFAIQHSLFSFSAVIFTSLSVSLSHSLGYSNIIVIMSIIGLFVAFSSNKIEFKTSNS